MWDDLTHSSQFQQAIRTRVAEARRRSVLGARSLPALPPAAATAASDTEGRRDNEGKVEPPTPDARAHLNPEPDLETCAVDHEGTATGDPPYHEGRGRGQERVTSRRLFNREPDSDDDGEESG